MARWKGGSIYLKTTQKLIHGETDRIDGDGGGNFSALRLDASPDTTISGLSTDGTLAGNSDTAIPTEKAIKTYVDAASTGDHNHDTDYLGITAQAADADTVDGLEASQFLRSDTHTGVSSDTELKVGVGEGALRLYHNSSENRGYIVPYDGGSWAWTKEIHFDADIGDWTIEGQPILEGLKAYSETNDGTLSNVLFGRNDDQYIALHGHSSGNYLTAKCTDANLKDFLLQVRTDSTTASYIFYRTGRITIDGDTVWHEGNGGSGSGLDADTVDTLEASQFLRSDTSDTMTGALTLQNGTDVNEFSTDTTLSGNSDDAVPTEKAVKTYVDTLPSRKNKIINGNFDIWQRATSQTSSGWGSDDRWSNLNVGSTKTHSRQSFTAGQTDVPGNPKYYSRTVVGSVAGAGNFCQKYQPIEDVRTFSGETCTLSFYAKADSAKDIATEFIQGFGTGGSPSSAVVAIGVTTHSLTTSWQKFTTKADIPSISGKTVGNDGNDYLQLVFWFDAGSTYNADTNSLGQQSGTFDIAQVQIERGDVATAFEDRHISQELAMCQRYYWQGVIYSSYDVRYTALAGTWHAGTISLPTPMRSSPTLGTITTPNLASATGYSLTGDSYSISLRATTTGSASYAVWGGVYSTSSEL